MVQGLRAGIAQLVEQATENRRVPSSNLGPGILDKFLMHFSASRDDGDRVFNNPDSFAESFDSAWKKVLGKESSEKPFTTEKKLEAVLETIKDHPFLVESPREALQVANFRIRLLNLS